MEWGCTSPSTAGKPWGYLGTQVDTEGGPRLGEPVECTHPWSEC